MNMQTKFEMMEEIGNPNPEEIVYSMELDHFEEIRCRFCYENSKPLISVCSCIGSIQYVHEQCILNWIEKKMEISQALQIPCCQICQEKFHASMKIGRRKLSLGLLVGHIKTMKNKQLLQGIAHAIMFVACLITILLSLNILYHDSVDLKTFSNQAQPPQNKSRTVWQILQFVFTNIVVEAYGIAHFLLFLKSKQKWLEDSMVQVVEVILQPNIIRKY